MSTSASDLQPVGGGPRTGGVPRGWGGRSAPPYYHTTRLELHARCVEKLETASRDSSIPPCVNTGTISNIVIRHLNYAQLPNKDGGFLTLTAIGLPNDTEYGESHWLSSGPLSGTPCQCQCRAIREQVNIARYNTNTAPLGNGLTNC